MRDKRNRHGAVGKLTLENIFVNAPPLPLLCEISGALHLAQPGLMAGWLAGWLTGWLVKQRCSIIAAVPMRISKNFRLKPIVRWFLKV